MTCQQRSFSGCAPQSPSLGRRLQPPTDEVDAPPRAPGAQTRRRRAPQLAVLAALALTLASGCGADSREKERSTNAPGLAALPSDGHDDEQMAEMAPLPKARPTLVQPEAGQASTASGVDLPVARPDAGKDPEVTGPASSSTRADVDGEAAASGLTATTATALPNGVALPPLEAPQAVLDVIRAGNIIAKSPYKWGGGHGNFQDSGYDCSGSVTYALYYAGLIARSATSGELMSYGEPGPGKWISIYSNPGHVYMIVAGIRFDTVARKLTGSRWQNSSVSAPGRYVVRHPPGL
jgi:cell wall-associated NlpC family hydrolase